MYIARKAAKLFTYLGLVLLPQTEAAAKAKPIEYYNQLDRGTQKQLTQEHISDLYRLDQGTAEKYTEYMFIASEFAKVCDFTVKNGHEDVQDFKVRPIEPTDLLYKCGHESKLKDGQLGPDGETGVCQHLPSTTQVHYDELLSCVTNHQDKLPVNLRAVTLEALENIPTRSTKMHKGYSVMYRPLISFIFTALFHEANLKAARGNEELADAKYNAGPNRCNTSRTCPDKVHGYIGKVDGERKKFAEFLDDKFKKNPELLKPVLDRMKKQVFVAHSCRDNDNEFIVDREVFDLFFPQSDTKAFVILPDNGYTLKVLEAGQKLRELGYGDADISDINRVFTTVYNIIIRSDVEDFEPVMHHERAHISMLKLKNDNTFQQAHERVYRYCFSPAFFKALSEQTNAPLERVSKPHETLLYFIQLDPEQRESILDMVSETCKREITELESTLNTQRCN